MAIAEMQTTTAKPGIYIREVDTRTWRHNTYGHNFIHREIAGPRVLSGAGLLAYCDCLHRWRGLCIWPEDSRSSERECRSRETAQSQSRTLVWI